MSERLSVSPNPVEKVDSGLFKDFCNLFRESTTEKDIPSLLWNVITEKPNELPSNTVCVVNIIIAATCVVLFHEHECTKTYLELSIILYSFIPYLKC